VLSAAVAAHCGPVCSLEAEVFPALAAAGALRGTMRAGWFIDIGIPEDYRRADIEMPGRLLGRPALILDRDGVLNVDHGYVGSRERLEWVAGAAAAVREAADRGWHVFIATNQSGVARGYYDEAAVRSLLAHMADTLRAAGGTIDDTRYCPTHPHGTVPAYAREDDWRKPRPGMLTSLIRAWSLEPARCVMLGDQATDLQAADAVGIAGHLFTGGDLHACVTSLLDSRESRAA
jgi:D-glycero-D-manno-heptose 1,7-bisphosphate phosphatase